MQGQMLGNKSMYQVKVFMIQKNIPVCGLILNSSNNLPVKAYCLKTSSLKDWYHKIDGEISTTSNIIKFIRSCPARSSEQRKHTMGVLFKCMK